MAMDADRWQHATMGLELVGYVLAFTGLGYLLDWWLGTTPWFTLGGALLGITGGLTKTIRDALLVNKNSPAAGQKPPAKDER
jgi:F0F1-type ATP synthase assembly protein I